MIYVAQGHDIASLASLDVELRVEEYPHYELDITSDGVGRPVGGATAVISAKALSYDEAIDVMDQLGLSLYVPSALCTIRIQDLHRLPTPFYGVVELDVFKTEGSWWTDFRLVFRNLVAA